jgi:hypothetical protein
MPVNKRILGKQTTGIKTLPVGINREAILVSVLAHLLWPRVDCDSLSDGRYCLHLGEDRQVLAIVMLVLGRYQSCAYP